MFVISSLCHNMMGSKYGFSNMLSIFVRSKFMCHCLQQAFLQEYPDFEFSRGKRASDDQGAEGLASGQKPTYPELTCSKSYCIGAGSIYHDGMGTHASRNITY